MAASGRTKGGMNTKLHAVTYANGRPIGFFRTAGQVSDDKRRYKRRNRIEIMFGRLKDWRRVATRYDRCPKAFFSAVALAATVIFWL